MFVAIDQNGENQFAFHEDKITLRTLSEESFLSRRTKAHSSLLS